MGPSVWEILAEVMDSMLFDTTWAVSPSLPLLGGAASDAAAARYLAVLAGRGYQQTEPVPLTEGDRTVHFVNANVTPHKPTLQAGEPIGALCAYQHCFRAHGEHPWLFAFGMAGLLTDLGTAADPGAADDLARIAVDSHDATVAAVPDQRADRIHVLVDAADDDLIAAVSAAAAPTGGTVHALVDSAISTRWDYGDGFDLSGRGVTYYYRRPDVGCADECRPDCKCARWQPLANLIVIDRGSVRYVETALGVEITAAIPFGLDPYALPEIADRVAAAEQDGIPPAAAADLVNLLRAVAAFVHDGARPAAKGAGSVVRRFLGRLITLLEEHLQPEAAATLLHRLGAPPALLSAVEAEIVRREEAGRRAETAAAAMLRRRPDVTDDLLSKTFGLDAATLAGLRAAAAPPEGEDRPSLLPARLRAGDQIAVVSPSWQGGRIFGARARRGAADLEAATGLRVIIPAELDTADRFARAEQFNQALRDSTIRGILWMIGGVAAAELLDLIDYDAFAADPKVVCGYSDATVLHHALYARTGVPVFYGPSLLAQFAETGGTFAETLQSFRAVTMDAWSGTYPVIESVVDEFVDWAGTDAPRHAHATTGRTALRPGTAEGPLLPACLPSALQLLGTPWLPDYAGHVLAVEFTDDGGYDPAYASRDLWQLRHAGLLDSVAAVLVGRGRGWTPDQRADLDRCLLEVCSGWDFPIVSEVEFGHTDPMLTLPTGARGRVDGTTLTLLSPAVR